MHDVFVFMISFAFIIMKLYLEGQVNKTRENPDAGLIYDLPVSYSCLS